MPFNVASSLEGTEPIGYIVDEASMDRFYFIIPKDSVKKVKFGEYVVVKNSLGEYVLGIVDSVSSLNWDLLLNRSQISERDLRQALRVKDSIKTREVCTAGAQVLGKIVEVGEKRIRIAPNREIITPLEGVFLAPDELLRIIFEKHGRIDIEDPKEGGLLPIGYLLSRYDKNRDEGPVKVSINLQNLLSRHFAVLAITGAGKSNTIALMTTRIVKEFDGTVLIIDTHGEYASLERDPKYRDIVKVLPLSIDFLSFEAQDLARLLGIRLSWHKVYNLVKKVFEEVKEEMKYSSQPSSEKLLEEIKKRLEDLVENGTKEEAKHASSALDRLMIWYKTLKEIATGVHKPDVLTEVEPKKLNILDISSLETSQMNIILKYILESIFEYRKMCKKEIFGGSPSRRTSVPPAFKKPILVVVEEAHLFASTGESEIEEAKSLIARIAREGRKFGISLGLVSQRPKKIDPDILSQCNTFIILKLIEKQDKNTVSEASETLSEELLASLNALDVGEALVVGSSVMLPSSLKIFKFDGEYAGKDIDFLEEWKRGEEESEDLISLDRGEKFENCTLRRRSPRKAVIQNPFHRMGLL